MVTPFTFSLLSNVPSHSIFYFSILLLFFLLIFFFHFVYSVIFSLSTFSFHLFTTHCLPLSHFIHTCSNISLVSLPSFVLYFPLYFCSQSLFAFSMNFFIYIRSMSTMEWDEYFFSQNLSLTKIIQSHS